jgi:O-antigen ligase
MNPSFASLVYACGIAALFYLDRDKSVKTSKALWLSVAYLWIIGSRPISAWLGMVPANGTDVQLEGSPVDAVFFGILFIAALVVLLHRGSQILRLLNANYPILIYFLFCLFSVMWSNYPGVALKRWFKAGGDLLMILVVVTDEQPVAALRRLFSRLGFILLPVSLLFIKYYPSLGRNYGVWSGEVINIGVTYDKNMLGVVAFVLSLGAFWRVLGLMQSKKSSPGRRRHLIAQGALLVLGARLLILADSATSLVCFVLGAGLIWATRRQFIQRNPAAVHWLVLSLTLIASLMLFGAAASVTRALGRNATLTGRTDIWANIIPLASNPWVGAGFESFWLSPRVHQRLLEVFPGLPLNEAHNGYLEVYLNLGWMGVSLIALILIDGYRRAVKAFRREPVLGSLLLAYVFTATTYNITEAGFRMLHPFWVFFLLAVIGASSFTAGVPVGASPPVDASPGRALELPARNARAMGLVKRTMTGKMARRQET